MPVNARDLPPALRRQLEAEHGETPGRGTGRGSGERAEGTLPMRCCACDERFTPAEGSLGAKAERHSDTTGHRRFELVLEEGTNDEGHGTTRRTGRRSKG